VDELTYKQRLFVSAFIGEAKGNATEAARIAGYGRSANALGVTGHDLLRKPKIQAAIEMRVSAVALSADEVLGRVAEQATADIGDYINIDRAGNYTVNLKRAKKDDKLRGIRKLRQGEHGVEIQLRDSLAALTLLGKYHSLWESDPSKSNVLAEAIRDRLKEKTEERLRRRAGNQLDAKPGSTD
jgi:hypothetical protein